MSNPVISIITPSFNRSEIIHETAKSVFNQTYPHWEWMIVDDGSTDNTWDLLKGYAAKDPRVKIFKRNRDPKGAAACRNIAIEKSSGDYLIFLDTDDILASFCLEQRINAFKEDPSNDFILFPMLLFKDIPGDTNILWNVENGMDDLLRIIYGDPVCPGSGTLWKKKTFIEIGMWNESILLWQDIELHIRALLQNVKFQKRLDLKPDFFIRTSDISLSRTGYNTLPKISSRMKVLSSGLEMAEREKKLEKYKIGFKNMARNIYLSMIYAHKVPFSYIRSIENLAKSFGLFTTHDHLLLRTYFLMYWTKLYKLTFIKKVLEKKVREIAPAPEFQLNKHMYTNKIEF